jgi:signal transduction histidine kinase
MSDNQANNQFQEELQMLRRQVAEMQRTEKDRQQTEAALVQERGLGLLICKEMVERNGGRIWAESEPGQGTTIAFTLPQG